MLQQLLLLPFVVAAAFNTNDIRPLLKKNHGHLSTTIELSRLDTNHEASSLSQLSSTTSTRTDFLRNMLVTSATALPILTSSPMSSNAAPPFAIMAEELGYFPVTDEKTGETVMVPAKAKRESTDQAVQLAKYLKSSNAVMYGAFWCPHCQRQKELFGKEAWKYITYVECSPKGYKSKYATCLSDGIDGYPSWNFGNGKSQGGEMELIDIATKSGFSKKFSFDASLEEGQVPSLGGGGCK